MLKPEERPLRSGEASLGPTRIGPTAVVQGEISGKEDVVVEGECRGKITLDHHDLIIEKSGKVGAEVRAKNVTIHGSMTGNVFASERTFISETGRMTGDITASKISVMDGAQFKGAIKMGKGNSA